MLRLTMLGGLAVAPGDGTAPLAVQRRRLALLVLVACAGERGLSRDKLLHFLWPDADGEGARHALTQALYALRRDLRVPELFGGSAAEVRLTPGTVASDVGEFRAALARGDLETAARLYEGPFLDGWHLGGASEFERWVDAERADIAKLAGRAFEALAGRAAAQGHHRRATEWWRRAATLEPLDSRIALALMQSLVAAGDRAAALRHARVHAALHREELDADPDPAVVAFAERLRTEAASLGARVTTERPTAPEPSPDAAPSRAGAPATDAFPERYRVERQIGRGRVTTCYLAHDQQLARPVALKVLHAELSVALAARRFMREIRLVARLRHPHILPLFDSGEVGRTLFYVTPYVEGGSLRARLQRERRLPAAEAMHVARQVAEALDHAHRRNAVHRDITPEHILLDDGQALLTGFGIARALEATFEPRLTEPGLALGAPAYRSPEQGAGSPALDGRSDLFSLGCVLLEMLVGRPPDRTATGAPDPLAGELAAELPAPLHEVLARTLAPDPAARYASAGELARALEALGHGLASERGVLDVPLGRI